MTLRRPTIRSRSPAAAGSARPQEIAATRVARIIERYSASVHNAMLAPRAHVWRSTPRARALSTMQSTVGAANERGRAVIHGQFSLPQPRLYPIDRPTEPRRLARAGV